MSELFCYAEHNGVLGNVVPWDELGGGAMQFAQGSPLHAPAAEIGRKDRTVVVRVICVGPGNVSRGSLNPCTIGASDLVVVNLLHRQHELRILGEFKSLFAWEHIMAKLHHDEHTKTIHLIPLQAYIICKPNEAAAAKLIMGERKILSPNGDAQFSGSYDEPVALPGRTPRQPDRNKTVVEECVAVGPGAVVDGLWQEPPQSLVGGMILYDASVSPVQFLAHGERYTLIHWRHVLFSFRQRKEEDGEERLAAIH